MEGYIYITTNLINGKQYIGRKSSEKFLGTNYLGSGVHLKNAINKYGEENFKVEILEEVDSKDNLIEREMYWINEYNAVNSNKFYNHSPGGLNEGFVPGEKNLINDPIVKSKMIKSKKGHYPEKHRKAMQEFYKNNPDAPKEWSRKRVENLLNNKEKYNQWITNLSKAQTGRTHSEESKEKIRKANTGSKLVNNGKIQHWIKPDELEEYLNNGYCLGGLPRNRDYTKENNPMYGKKGKNNPNYGKVAINNGNIRKKVLKEEVQGYLNNGWKLGFKF